MNASICNYNIPLYEHCTTVLFDEASFIFTVQMATNNSEVTENTTQVRQTRSRNDAASSDAAESPATSTRRTQQAVSTSNLLTDILKEMKALNTKIERLTEITLERQDTIQQRQREEDMTNSPQRDVDITRLISIQDKTWKDTMNKRKRAYFDFYKNEEKAKLYEEYLNRATPFIPRSCKEKDIPGQVGEEWQNIKKEREVSNTRHQVDRMKAFARQHQSKVQELDDSIVALFTHLPQDTLNRIKNTWATEAKLEENVSQEMWKKKKDFLSKLPDRTEEETGTSNSRRPSTSRNSPRSPRSNSPQTAHNRNQTGSAGRRRFGGRHAPSGGRRNNGSNNEPHFLGERRVRFNST